MNVTSLLCNKVPSGSFVRVQFRNLEPHEFAVSSFLFEGSQSQKLYFLGDAFRPLN